jgi:hypothetical protein
MCSYHPVPVHSHVSTLGIDSENVILQGGDILLCSSPEPPPIFDYPACFLRVRSLSTTWSLHVKFCQACDHQPLHFFKNVTDVSLN